MFTFEFLILIVLQFLLLDAVPNFEPCILHGDPADIKEFPFFVGTEVCGASILSDRWLITAAHCVDNPQGIGRKLVYAGSNQREKSVIYRYGEIKIHPKYNPSIQGHMAYDIALLKLVTPLNFSDTIKPVKLPPTKVFSRNPMYVFVGRGQDETGKPSQSIKKLTVNRLSPAECAQVYDFRTKELRIPEDIFMCVRRIEKTPGVCMGDSGSPLLQNGVIMGLASFLPIPKRDCTLTNIAFFTHVPPFVPWIKSVTGLR